MAIDKAFGIDVSRWQEKVDWKKIKAQGFEFVFVRATQGISVKDSLFAAHWAGAKAAGLLRGAYHFFEPTQDGVTQAHFFLKTLGDDLGELPPVFDLESNQTPPYPRPGDKVVVVDNATLSKRSQEWIKTVQTKAGRTPIMYTRARFWNDFMKDRQGKYPEWAAPMKLWTANYIFADREPAPDEIEWFMPKVAVPKSWPKWDFWQFTDDAKRDGITNKDGIQSKIDLNLFNGTVDELKEFAAAHEEMPVSFAAPGSEGPAFMPDVTNQEMIEAFSRAFGAGFWDIVKQAGLESLAQDRDAKYSGQPVDFLPLDEVEVAKLKVALGA